ncbi:MAG: coproporphyrinogen dehydrogenase HemZ [Clostridia bacterium]|nr:coproporphyrinogen dehydrogenase HemZ [Clostridia bacterium]
MKILVEGGVAQYDAEALAMLFMPGRHFTSVTQASELTEEYLHLISRTENGCLHTRACLCSADTTAVGESTLPCTDPPSKADLRLGAAYAILEAGERLTGVTPPFGVLTGIRPAKIVMEMLRQGSSPAQIESHFRDTLRVTEEKTSLCMEVAAREQALISRMPPRSVSLYISIPFCPSRCTYCSFVSHSIESAGKLIDPYLEKLCAEIRDKVALLKDMGRPINCIYIGGGTPGILTPEQLTLLMGTVSDVVNLSQVAEYTVEAGRPDTVTKDKLRVMKMMGAQRISINPQTLCNDTLQLIGRRHTAEQFYQAMDVAASAGFDCINCDLVAGLAQESPEEFGRTLEGVLSTSPQNVTVHTLCVKKSAFLRQSGEAVFDPLGTRVGAMLTLADSLLRPKGFFPYYLYRQKNALGNFENTGWSLDGKEGLYNVYIMEEVQSILACGAGGTTKLVDTEKNLIRRIFNFKYPYEYLSRPIPAFSEEEKSFLL